MRILIGVGSAAAIALVLAAIDGGREPLRPIVQDVVVPAAGEKA